MTSETTTYKQSVSLAIGAAVKIRGLTDAPLSVRQALGELFSIANPAYVAAEANGRTRGLKSLAVVALAAVDWVLGAVCIALSSVPTGR